VIDLERHPAGPVDMAVASEACPEAMVFFDRDVVTGARARLPDPFELLIQRYPVLVAMGAGRWPSEPGPRLYELRWVGRLVISCRPGSGVCYGTVGLAMREPRHSTPACDCLIWRPLVWSAPSGRERSALLGMLQVSDALWVDVSRYGSDRLIEVHEERVPSPGGWRTATRADVRPMTPAEITRTAKITSRVIARDRGQAFEMIEPEIEPGGGER
jgi:hypothetical protein